MIRRIVHIVVECDSCAVDTDRSDYGSVPDAKAEAIADGWHISRTRVLCPVCRKDSGR